MRLSRLFAPNDVQCGDLFFWCGFFYGFLLSPGFINIDVSRTVGRSVTGKGEPEFNVPFLHAISFVYILITQVYICFLFSVGAYINIEPSVFTQCSYPFPFSLVKTCSAMSLATISLGPMSAPRLPPYLMSTDHRQRCLAQLRSKASGLEKYIYLNGLKERDPTLFYDILLDNMLEIIPILYTPTVNIHLVDFTAHDCLHRLSPLGRRRLF